MGDRYFYWDTLPFELDNYPLHSLLPVVNTNTISSETACPVNSRCIQVASRIRLHRFI